MPTSERDAPKLFDEWVETVSTCVRSCQLTGEDAIEQDEKNSYAYVMNIGIVLA